MTVILGRGRRIMRHPRNLPWTIAGCVEDLTHAPYAGDAARVLLNGKLIDDDFYNGKAWEVGLRRHAPEIAKGELRVAVLPLRTDAPIYLAEQAKPSFGDQQSAIQLRNVELVRRRTFEFGIE